MTLTINYKVIFKLISQIILIRGTELKWALLQRHIHWKRRFVQLFTSVSSQQLNMLAFGFQFMFVLLLLLFFITFGLLVLVRVCFIYSRIHCSIFWIKRSVARISYIGGTVAIWDTYNNHERYRLEIIYKARSFHFEERLWLLRVALWLKCWFSCSVFFSIFKFSISIWGNEIYSLP